MSNILKEMFPDHILAYDEVHMCWRVWQTENDFRPGMWEFSSLDGQMSFPQHSWERMREAARKDEKRLKFYCQGIYEIQDMEFPD